MNELPSIVTALTPDMLEVAHFIKPTVYNAIFLCHQEDTDASPASQVLRIVQLRLRRYDAIPVHAHRKKEKVYILEQGLIHVFMYIKGGWKRFILKNKGDRLVIPPLTPHSVFCCEYNVLLAEMLVIVSSQDGADIVWEPNADELVKNIPRV